MSSWITGQGGLGGRSGALTPVATSVDDREVPVLHRQLWGIAADKDLGRILWRTKPESAWNRTH